MTSGADVPTTSVLGVDLTAAAVGRVAMDEARAGACVLDLGPSRDWPTCVVRSAELVLVGVRGEVDLGDGVLARGRLLVWPRGRALTLRARSRSARLALVAVPAGPDELFAALGRGDLPPAALVALAADTGVELRLAQLPRSGLAGRSSGGPPIR